MKKSNYKRGDKHPTKNLLFWQYHHPFYKETNGEVWYSTEVFNKKCEEHRYKSSIYRTKNPLLCIISGTIQRDKKKYNTPKEDIIDLCFIKKLLKKQNNKCYWYNIELEIDSIKGSRNPSKLTIDRLDCTKGYSKDNVVLTCYASNCGRGDCPTEIWEKIVKNIKIGLNNKK